MKTIIACIVIVIFLFFISVISTSTVKLETEEINETISNLKFQVEYLIQENKRLKNAHNWIPVLQQILPMISKDELNLIAEQLRQARQKEVIK